VLQVEGKDLAPVTQTNSVWIRALGSGMTHEMGLQMFVYIRSLLGGVGWYGNPVVDVRDVLGRPS
jgi:hypothetical protein